MLVPKCHSVMVFIHIPGVSLSADPTGSFTASQQYSYVQGSVAAVVLETRCSERGEKLHLDTDRSAVRERRVQSLDY